MSDRVILGTVTAQLSILDHTFREFVSEVKPDDLDSAFRLKNSAMITHLSKRNAHLIERMRLALKAAITASPEEICISGISSD